MEKNIVMEKIMTAAPVIVVATIGRPEDAVKLARALVAGGLSVIEVTLRTPCALEAIRVIATEVEGATVGAGTVTATRQMDEAVRAGAQFMVSPGFTLKLLAAAKDTAVPFLPGASSAAEIMQLGEAGYRCLKFFPAGAAGGPQYLKSLAGPLPQFKFCPTGGINPSNMGDYLKLSNVLCVGGSWLTPLSLVNAGDWGAITKLASTRPDLENRKQ